MDTERLFDVENATATQSTRVLSNPDGIGYIFRFEVTSGTGYSLVIRAVAVGPNGEEEDLFATAAVTGSSANPLLFWATGVGVFVPGTASLVNENIQGVPHPERFKFYIDHGNANAVSYTLDIMPDNIG
jgi:hypothetical protein